MEPFTNNKPRFEIGVEGYSTPAGLAGQVRPHRSVSDEEAQASRPAESEYPGAEIIAIATMYTKRV
ncbi:hypothetical protein AB986_18830 [Alkalihalobacillus macyae]|uniref:Uncharacterized protein n=1 Tax=Guptibacillus hwajinpoensis TaxID=208199 RepID=A0A0J6CVS9_9BACL|nr:hypothetical protein AB986_18830 [Alkalihalobacillus macyae]